MIPQALLKLSRQVHLYLGVFITPALLFFAFTGAIQTAQLHETSRDLPNYKPAHWIVVLAQIHKKQTTTVPDRRPPQPSPAAAPVQKPSTPPEPPRKNPVPLRVFFLFVCLGLFTSTLTGLYMSYKFIRNKPLITATLIAGVVVPLILTLL